MLLDGPRVWLSLSPILLPKNLVPPSGFTVSEAWHFGKVGVRTWVLRARGRATSTAMGRRDTCSGAFTSHGSVIRHPAPAPARAWADGWRSPQKTRLAAWRWIIQLG